MSGIDESNPRGAIRIHPPALAGILLLAALVLHLLGHSHHRFAAFHQLLGLLLVAAAVGLAFYAAGLFAATGTTRNPYRPPTELITLIPYTFTRNPMYLGMTVVLLGIAFFFGSAVMLLAPIVFFVVIDRMVIPAEETNLQQLFGQQYLDYKSRARRWL
jgi:protein-S-isoprenylcysteine O-methyltransferase Ste14